MSRFNKGDWTCFSIGGIFVLIAIGLGIAWSFIYAAVLKSYLELTPSSYTYKMWVRTPIPMYLDIYLFNISNAEEFARNQTIKPNLEEIGPFVFKEVHDRVNVTWNIDGSVSYNQTRNWTFVPELSANIKSPITNLNVIALSVAHLTQYEPALLKTIIDDLILRKPISSLLVTKPANEWLFDGMNLTLLNLLRTKYISKYVNIPYDKFGFFYQRNLSADYDGRFQMRTGSHKLNDLGVLNLWNSKNKTEYFDSYCGMVNGSSGEIFGPLEQDVQDFTLFITDVCSSLTLKYKEDAKIGGIVGKKFIGDETMFDNGANVTSRKCFCDGECSPSGTRNLTRCRQGAPVFVSFPHFYLADSSYLEGIDGLNPNQSLHEFQIVLEPTSGIPLDVRAKLQVNFRLQPYPFYKMYKSTPNIYLPVMWFTQRAHITPNLADQASLLLNVNVIGISVASCLFVLGLLLIIGRSYFLYKRLQLQSDQELLIDSSVGDQ